MIAVPRKYQAVFFGHIADIQPSADTIPPLLEAFRVPGLLPSTFHEVGLAVPMAAAQVRLRLSTPDNEWTIDFETNRINIQKNSVKPLGSNLGSPEDFTRDAIDFLGRILGKFPRRANRLALVTNGLMDEMPAEKLETIYNRLLVPLKFYVENRPIAWNSRTLARITVNIDGKDETLNVITKVNRVQGNLAREGAISRFDRVEVEFDINTYQDNADARFETSSVYAFYSRALGVRTTLLKMIEEQING